MSGVTGASSSSPTSASSKATISLPMKFDELGQGGQDGENIARDQDQLSLRSKKFLAKWILTMMVL